MDKEQARFVLRSFRPDGADVSDVDFAEALTLAMENRELGEWLAHERAFDAAFAQALGSINLPENLREDIIACLAVERGDFPQVEDSSDSLLVGAFASIQPPAFLRDELIAAMERTTVMHQIRTPFWRRYAIPLAAAAGIALAFVFTRSNEVTGLTHFGPVRSELVRASFIKAFESPTFSLEEKQDDHRLLVQHLKDRNLPIPDVLPPGLENVKALGCRELVIDGKHGSVICFNMGADGAVHLVVFNREDIQGTFPDHAQPLLVQNGHWASAQWQDDKKVYILMGDTDLKKLKVLL
ncbi:MAG: hypothetical protein ABI600_13825 [Luteolibacter sp.]